MLKTPHAHHFQEMHLLHQFLDILIALVSNRIHLATKSLKSITTAHQEPIGLTASIFESTKSKRRERERVRSAVLRWRPVLSRFIFTRLTMEEKDEKLGGFVILRKV